MGRPPRFGATAAAATAACAALVLLLATVLAFASGPKASERAVEVAAVTRVSTGAVVDHAASPPPLPDPIDRPVATATSHTRGAVGSRALSNLLLLFVAGLLGWTATSRRWGHAPGPLGGAIPRSWIACSVAPRAPPLSSRP